MNKMDKLSPYNRNRELIEIENPQFKFQIFRIHENINWENLNFDSASYKVSLIT